jgi:Na+/melibiose symporter-like transporter
MFYSSLFMLISDVVGDGPKDQAFTVVAMVRAATFAFGALVFAAFLSTTGPAVYRMAIVVDVVSVVIAAAVVAVGLRTPAMPPQQTAARPARLAGAAVLRDRPYLGLIAVTMLFALPQDFFLVGMPVFTLDILGSPPWLPGALLVLLTVIGSTAGTLALHWTRRWSRVKAMQVAAIAIALWCAASVAATPPPTSWRTWYLLGCAILLAAAQLVSAGRVNALAEAATHPQARARYLATFQYAFTIAGVLAPAVVALFSVAVWFPWLVLAAAAGAASVGLRYLGAHLPSHALGVEYRN